MLEILIANRNKLTGFPSEIGSLRSLRKVDVSYNQMQPFGNALENLPNLDELNLGNNPGFATDTLGPRARRLADKRTLLASKTERRALITRALGVQRSVLNKEQDAIMQEFAVEH